MTPNETAMWLLNEEAQDRHETDEHDGHGGRDPGRELERLVTASALNGTFDDFVSGK